MSGGSLFGITLDQTIILFVECVTFLKKELIKNICFTNFEGKHFELFCVYHDSTYSEIFLQYRRTKKKWDIWIKFTFV